MLFYAEISTLVHKTGVLMSKKRILCTLVHIAQHSIA